ncbi:MAG: amidohydrolase, partial [Bryobacterales bacterium]|nr:amidohydrolase [Bryobacterales bacterium]
MKRSDCTLLLSSALLIVLSFLSACGTPQPSEPTSKEQVMKYGIVVKSGPMDSVLLKDYQPESSLVLPRTEVTKARFPVIDIHTHSGMSHIKTTEDVDAWVRTMDEVGVEYTVVFTDAFGDDFAKQIALFAPHKDRFQLWCLLDTENVDDPDYPKRAAAAVERCYEMGARGIGEITDKGSGLQETPVPKAQRLHIDD